MSLLFSLASLMALTTAMAFGLWLRMVPAAHPDRLAAIPVSATTIDNISPYDSDSKWIYGGPNTGLHVMNPARVEYFEEHLRSAGRKVLDVGCGAGLVSNALARTGHFELHGVDLSTPAVAVATSEASKHELPASFQTGSVYELPFPNASFDAVVASDFLEHLTDLRWGLREMHRVLRPGGIFVYDTINRSYLSHLIAIVFGESIFRIMAPNSHDWRLFITPEEMQRAFKGLFRSEANVRSLEPSLSALVSLVLFQMGIINANAIRGGFVVKDSPEFFLVSYIGAAVRM